MGGEAQSLREVLQMTEKRQQHSGIVIRSKGLVNIGVLAKMINRSHIPIGQSRAEDNLKKAVLGLTDGIACLRESKMLTDREQDALAADIDELVEESGKEPAERRQGIISRALDHILTFAERAAAAGTPILDLVTRVQKAFAGRPPSTATNEGRPDPQRTDQNRYHIGALKHPRDMMSVVRRCVWKHYVFW
jgi:hypothetical protein